MLFLHAVRESLSRKRVLSLQKREECCGRRHLTCLLVSSGDLGGPRDHYKRPDWSSGSARETQSCLCRRLVWIYTAALIVSVPAYQRCTRLKMPLSGETRSSPVWGAQLEAVRSGRRPDAKRKITSWRMRRYWAPSGGGGPPPGTDFIIFYIRPIPSCQMQYSTQFKTGGIPVF